MRLLHRGPDGHATHHDGALAFASSRLAIIDLSAPAGPLFNEDGCIGIVFNGEVYNHNDLRAALAAHGHVFKTRTDTEALVHAYEQWGIDMLPRLRGRFAFGIWDSHKNRLLLARDRLGQSPLYYAQTEHGLLFASEIKALLADERLPRRVNQDALPQYLTLGYVPPPQTLFSGINKLAAGSYLLVENGRTRIDRYWTPVMDASDPISENEAAKQVRDALFEAVALRLMSDVPLGAFLSGGVDSTAITAIMGQLMGRPVETFTVGFDFEPGSASDHKFNVDAHYAARAAHHLNSHHHIITLKQNDSLAELLPHLVYGMDEPIAELAVVQTVYVAALARLHGVPVLLSGDAGDELFAGYNHFRMDRILERYLRIPPLLRDNLLTRLLEHLPARFDSLRALAHKSRRSDPSLRYLEWHHKLDIDRAAGLLTHHGNGGVYKAINSDLRPWLDAPDSPYFADRIAYASTNLWIPEDSNMRVDKMAMMMSIEARAPFQDHPLVELALRLPLDYKLRGNDTKRILKAAIGDLVPDDILNRPKWGFIPPASEWLRTYLHPLVETYLSREYVESAGCFDPDGVQALVDAHLKRERYDLAAVWALLVFHIWHALYIDGSLTLERRLQAHDLSTELEFEKQ